MRDESLQTPQPTAAIIAVAVLQFLVSGATLAFFGLLLWGIVISYRRFPHNHEVLPPVFWTFFIAFPLAFAALGIVTSIGLVRLREWARRGTIFLSVVPVSTYTLLLVWRPSSVFPANPRPGGPYAIGDVVGLAVGALVVMLIPIGIWWLVLFRQLHIRAQFRPRSE